MGAARTRLERAARARGNDGRAQRASCADEADLRIGPRGFGLGDEGARRPDAADERQLQARGTEADAQAEHVELEALDAARSDAEQAAKGELDAVAARRGIDDLVAEVVLA